jgi:3-methyl-2-oxobutanoate hydroxymethyltransferase
MSSWICTRLAVSAGRTEAEASAIVADAVALERAAAAMLLIEAVPEEVTQRVMEATSAPLIGIGAGPACHGQVLVLQDLLGMTDRPPRFASPVAHLGEQLEAAGREWVARVRERRLGAPTSVVTKGQAQAHRA